MNTVKVFGHRSPDTDASCSAVVWAWFLQEKRNIIAQPYILGPVNTEAEFVFESFGVTMPSILDTITAGEDVAIVDTNNLDELFENINEANIISIIDHHKLTGTLRTNLPLELVIQPYASTMTVMYNVMNIEVADLPRHIAGLMLSGILSDTLAFRSPTTTQTDKDLAQQLASVLDIDMHEYASKMFDAKSNISDFSAAELIRMDSKIYEVAGKQTRVSVLETTNPTMVLDRFDEITATYAEVMKADQVDQILLFAIDILNKEATLLVPDLETKELAEKCFEKEITGNTLLLPEVMSRKKQILPALTR